MLKFVKAHLENMEGVSLYPIISLLLFALFFILLFARLYFFKNEQLERHKRLPLNED